MAGDTGYTPRRPNPKSHHNETVERAAGPFNGCTNVAIAPNGDLYMADGYGNARVHCFSPDGTLRFSWGEPGTGPGQFHLPHSIAVAADGRARSPTGRTTPSSSSARTASSWMPGLMCSVRATWPSTVRH